LIAARWPESRYSSILVTASALSAMLEHFCCIWLGQGGEKDVPFDDERALDAVATIWEKAVYWRPGPG
jgi:hypothetical protein